VRAGHANGTQTSRPALAWLPDTAITARPEAGLLDGVAPKAVWRNVARLARSLAVHRQGLWV
jgi:hypothetical protein